MSRFIFTCLCFFCLLNNVHCQNINDSSKLKNLGHQTRPNKTKDNKQANWLFDQSDNLSNLIGYSLIAIATYFSFHQWKKEQRWRRKEIIINRGVAFQATPGARNASLMLEWDNRNIPLWDAERPEDRYVKVTRKEVATALIPKQFLPLIYSPKESAIRDSFEDFFTNITKLNFYCDWKLLKKDDTDLLMQRWLFPIKQLNSSTDDMDKKLLRHLILYVHSRNMFNIVDILNSFDINLNQKIEDFSKLVIQEIQEGKWVRIE